MNDTTAPPRAFGVLLALLGTVLAFAGLRLMSMGDNASFVIEGLGVLASGVFIALGRKIGGYIYAATIAVIVLWAFAEADPSSELLPRIALPLVIGAYIGIKIQPRLR